VPTAGEVTDPQAGSQQAQITTNTARAGLAVIFMATWTQRRARRLRRHRAQVQMPPGTWTSLFAGHLIPQRCPLHVPVVIGSAPGTMVMI
jgi:hypothetical protein